MRPLYLGENIEIKLGAILLLLFIILNPVFGTVNEFYALGSISSTFHSINNEWLEEHKGIKTVDSIMLVMGIMVACLGGCFIIGNAYPHLTYLNVISLTVIIMMLLIYSFLVKGIIYKISKPNVEKLDRFKVVTFANNEKVVVLENCIYNNRKFVYVNEILPDESDVTDIYYVMEIHGEDGTLEKIVDAELLKKLLPIFQEKLERYL